MLAKYIDLLLHASMLNIHGTDEVFGSCTLTTTKFETQMKHVTCKLLKVKKITKLERVEHSENKSIGQSGPFENEVVPAVLQSSFNKHARWKNARRLSHRQLPLLPFCSCCLKFL